MSTSPPYTIHKDDFNSLSTGNIMSCGVMKGGSRLLRW